MPSSSVLKRALVIPERRRVRAEDVSWPGGGEYLAGANADPLLYSERDVERLLADMRREVLAEGHAAGFEEGHTAGFEAGQREGIEIGRQQEHDLIRGGSEMLAMLAETIVRERSRIIAEASRDLVQLALTMAERIVRHGLPLEDEAVLRAIREALGQVGDARRIVVRLNPREVELVETHSADLGALVAADAHIELRPDPGVTPGGCLMETPELHLDATVETLLGRFEEILTAWSAQVTLETAGESVGEVPAGNDACSPDVAAAAQPGDGEQDSSDAA